MTTAQWERNRRKFERKFAQAFVDAQRQQIRPILRQLKKDKDPYFILNNATVLIRREPFERALIDLYTEVMTHFGRLTLNDLEGREKKFLEFTSDFWRQTVVDYIRKFSGQKITWMTKTTADFVLSNTREAITEGEQLGQSIPEISQNLIQKYETNFPQFAQYRAERIARTEIVEASNYGSYKTAQTVDIPLKKIWISADDTRTRESHMRVEGVGLNDKFQVDAIFSDTGRLVTPAAEMAYPGDPTAPPGQTINCRCAIGYERLE
jgi:hypothetical protein